MRIFTKSIGPVQATTQGVMEAAEFPYGGVTAATEATKVYAGVDDYYPLNNEYPCVRFRLYTSDTGDESSLVATEFHEQGNDSNYPTSFLEVTFNGLNPGTTYWLFVDAFKIV